MVVKRTFKLLVVLYILKLCECAENSACVLSNGAVESDPKKCNETRRNEEKIIKNDGGGASAQRYTQVVTRSRRRRTQTTELRITFVEKCDYLAHYCMKAYDTGMLCARTVYFHYLTFRNYCMMDFVNCMERYEVWQVVHMGECFNLKVLTHYEWYPDNEDRFLDEIYVLDK